jgi:hypothetical protein
MIWLARPRRDMDAVAHRPVKARRSMSNSRLTVLAAAAGLTWPCAAWAASAGGPPDFQTLGSLAAVAISLIALVATQWSTHAKTQRELREELKESIEKLIEIRSEFTAKFQTFATEPQREFFASSMNTRKLIYLESAEHIATSLPYVTPAEWMVLGFEHMSDSNFHHAERIYERAVLAARQSSTVTQVSALRQLAAARMSLGPATVEKARDTFARAVNLMRNRADPYSGYTAALTYRMWAEAELNAGYAPQGRARLDDALAAAARMPDWFDYKGFEIRRCATDLMSMSDRVAQLASGPDHLAAAIEPLTAAAAALAPFGDPFSQELRGQVLSRRAALEARTQPAAPPENRVEAPPSLS